jgi:enoyl-CoA hydratase/carnithine racemase
VSGAGSDALVLESREGDVVTLTLNDPAHRNAMSEAMGEAFAREAARVANDASVRAVIVSGAGKAFCAGGDFDMLEALTERAHAEPVLARPGVSDFMRRFYQLFLSVRQIPVPTIAAVQGHAIGAGFCLALACDIRLLAHEAKVGLNFVQLGLHPGMGVTWSLPRLVGPAVAAELLYTGRILDGEEAAAIGLANRAMLSTEIPDAARQMAAQIAANAPLAVRGTKRSLAASGASSLEDQLTREAREQALGYESDDMREGLSAAREGRAAGFQGR